jgi:hypothetical protein
MATIYGNDNFGLFINGNFESGTNSFFTFGTINNTDAFSGNFCLQSVGGSGNGFIGSQRIPINTSLTYQMIAYARTLQRGSQNNSLAGGHIGFACYDKNDLFIDLRNCGGVGNTTLSRNLTSGDSFAYITNNSGWSTNANSAFRHILIYPSSHPDYSTPYEYTRIGFGNPTITYNLPITLMPEGDYRLELASTFPNIGYSTPAGTPVSNGQAGGTYNYALGNPNYPESWTRYATALFTGESRTSSTPFRFATKFIRFLILRNFNQRLETPQDHVWALDNVFFGLCQGGRDYRNVL